MIPSAMYMQTIVTLFEPIAPFMRDASVSEILINGPGQVFVEQAGRLRLTEVRFASSACVMSALRSVAQYVGQLLDADAPILEARLPDGSRLQAVIAPIAQHGPVVAIRRFARSSLGLARLVELGTLTADAAQLLVALTAAKCNIIVAGGTGTGKTSLLNVLAARIAPEERVLVLEDTRELAIEREHVVYFEARKPDAEGQGAVTIRDLFRASLRLRPDRIVVGEIRGAEAMDMMQAMVSGHDGGLSTLHASDPGETLLRLETMCMMSDVPLPLSAIRMQIGSGIDVIVQLARHRDGVRAVTHITEVAGFDTDTGKYRLNELYTRVYGADPEGAGGELVATGIAPALAERLARHGVRLPERMSQARRL